ncbi:hypothetical protein [Desulfosediminicola ganghwensis]|uniref:hypothetical protein n=1 Tax=Desulfosediminicola ganghwensis TaxID=2569540 RepID=UPI0010AD0A3F|nr:hypothetical protein [Desulfosediminicola ganghwensis]
MFKKLFGLEKKEAKRGNPDAVRLGVDLEMSYCPKCNEEYRLDVERCVHCQVELISGEERLGLLTSKEQGFTARSMEIADGESMVAIREGKLRDLKPYQILLGKDRIPALLNGDAAGCAKG